MLPILVYYLSYFMILMEVYVYLLIAPSWTLYIKQSKHGFKFNQSMLYNNV
jgi:hypothetical protein